MPDPNGARPEPTKECDSVRVVVADDDPVHRKNLSWLLERDGYTVRTVDSGAAAIQCALEWAPDVMILDLDMPPGIDGFEACREILQRCSPPPSLLFVSAHASTVNVVHGVDIGGYDYIAKPYDPEHLLSKVRAAARFRRQVAELAARVTLDPLTGVFNRAEFSSRFESLASLSQRNGDALAAVALDIDNFKRINDTHGHPAGDRILVELARRLREVARRSDAIFRTGGEEFVLLGPCAEPQAATTFAERIRLRVCRTPFVIENLQATTTIPVTISVGVACWLPGRTMEESLAAADQALYLAKARGRNRVESAQQPPSEGEGHRAGGGA